jgi:molecular chaperone GrpE (heat shock protein)
MIKNILFVATALALTLFVVSCAAKVDYSDLKAAMEKEVADIATFTAAVDAATDAKAQAAALEAFVAAYKPDVDAFNAALAKHAEAQKDIPAELQDVAKKLSDANAASGAALGKITAGQFATDPDVVAALQKVADFQAAQGK